MHTYLCGGSRLSKRCGWGDSEGGLPVTSAHFGIRIRNSVRRLDGVINRFEDLAQVAGWRVGGLSRPTPSSPPAHMPPCQIVCAMYVSPARRHEKGIGERSPQYFLLRVTTSCR